MFLHLVLQSLILVRNGNFPTPITTVECIGLGISIGKMRHGNIFWIFFSPSAISQETKKDDANHLYLKMKSLE